MATPPPPCSCSVGTVLDALGADYGLKLHRSGEVAAESSQLREWLLEELHDIADELPPERLDHHRRRFDSIVAIGHLVSGDPIVLDPSLGNDPNEPPVALLDHENLLVGVVTEFIEEDDDGVRTWANAGDFLDNAVSDPIRFLGDSWRYRTDDGMQFYVVSSQRR